MKKLKKWFTLIIIIAGALIIDYRKYDCKKPELMSTINSMNCEYCSIIIYKKYVRDKVELALHLIEVCRENAFENIKFATDIRGYPSALHLIVYLNKTDFFEGNCTQSMRKFKIEYCGTEANNVGAAIIPEEYLLKFKEALKNDYGYPPYERKTVETRFKNTEKRYGFNAD